MHLYLGAFYDTIHAGAAIEGNPKKARRRRHGRDTHLHPGHTKRGGAKRGVRVRRERKEGCGTDPNAGDEISAEGRKHDPTAGTTQRVVQCSLQFAVCRKVQEGAGQGQHRGKVPRERDLGRAQPSKPTASKLCKRRRQNMQARTTRAPSRFKMRRTPAAGGRRRCRRKRRNDGASYGTCHGRQGKDCLRIKFILKTTGTSWVLFCGGD